MVLFGLVDFYFFYFFFPWHLDFSKLNWELGNGIWSIVSLFYLQLCLRLILSHSDLDWSASCFGSRREVAMVVCQERQRFKIRRYKRGGVEGPEVKISATCSFSPHLPASLRELAQFLKWSLSFFTEVWHLLRTTWEKLQHSAWTANEQCHWCEGTGGEGAWGLHTGVEVQMFTSGHWEHQRRLGRRSGERGL